MDKEEYEVVNEMMDLPAPVFPPFSLGGGADIDDGVLTKTLAL